MMLIILYIIAASAILAFIITQTILFFKNKVNSTKQIPKEIVEYANGYGRKYWVVKIHGKSTDIKWTKYEDAEFFYTHVNTMPDFDYIYSYSKQRPYYWFDIDDIRIRVVPADETNTFSYNVLENVYWLHSENNYPYRNLEAYYNSLTKGIYKETKVVLSNQDKKDIDKRLNLIIKKDELAELRDLIKEYESTVELSNYISEKLINMCKR